MEKARFTEEPIIGILREHEAGAATRMYAASTDQQRDVIQVKGEV